VQKSAWIWKAAATWAATAIAFGATPQHASDANQLVADLNSNVANTNIYDADGNLTDQIDWVGSPRTAISVCATFVTMLMKHSYGLTDAQYKAKTGSSSPNSARYYDAIAAWSGFTPVAAVDQMLQGDVIAIKYPAGQNSSGHTMVVDTVSTFQSRVLSNQTFLANNGEPAVAGYFDVTVIDSSASYHGKTDTRYLKPGGIGRNGIFRIFVDGAFQITGYTWSNEKSSVYKKAADGYLLGMGRFQPAGW
jgi:hypothetical protein